MRRKETDDELIAKLKETHEPLTTTLKKPRKRLYLNKTKSGVGYVTH